MNNNSMTRPFLHTSKNKTFLVVVCVALTLAATAVQAQPRISYIIPDIGTTRFATYVEFIGPYNTTSNFGTDGFYSNNPSGSAVRVRPARVADSVYVKIGPCVVSWNGRMVSTHIFVTPAAAPNSDVWSLLNAQWRIPLIVEVNGVASAADTFYIVRPFAFGDRRTDTKRILGDGQLGLRSRRGAMIVDSMVLAGGGLYTVSTADCDLGTPGNQGYLPLVLITAKSVTGGSGAKIILSGNGADAGPGGGGGGGGYANKPFFGSGTKRGTPGGAGFTGGGPGGYNDNSGDGSKQAPGAGTGDVLLASSTNVDGSKSLNGTPGGESFFRIWENAGGGTGHPFGRSGMGCAGTSSCVPIPGHGGGSGYRNGDPGGGGGFFEDGAGGPLRGGLEHGNDVLVPLAGGSGGASGNPNSYDNTSGFGGGGGGALSFHAARIVNLDIEAHGATSNREDTKGGGGSGGGIIIGTRVNGGSSVFPQTNGLDDQPNFNRGGGGRKRYDTPISFTPAPPRGPYSDSLTAVLRTFSITGAGDGRPIEVWVRSESSTWTLNTTITAFSPSNSFINATITLPGTDSIFYVMYAQQSANPSGAQYSAIPSHVLSQSAWNILRIFGPTIIDAVQNVDLGVRRCPNSVLTKSITIYNRGESPLEVRTPTWLNSNGFRIVSPTVFPDTIKVRDSTTYVIEYSPLPGATGVINDVLVLSNNDPVSARSPYRINVTATVERIELNYTYKGEVRDTIDLGAVCLGSVISEIVTITNIGTTSTTVTSVRSLNPSVVNATTSVPALLAVGGTTTIQLGGSLRAVGASIVPIVVLVAECPQPDTVYVRFVGIEPNMVLIGTTQFADVRVGQTRQVLVEIRNDGSSDLRIDALPPVAAPFRIVSAVPAPPMTLKPGASTIVTFEYAPTAVGDDSATLELVSTVVGGSCGDTIVIALAGRGIQEALVLDKNQIVFGDVRSCETVVDSVRVTNNGTADVVLLYPGFLNGPDAASFSIILQPLVDDTLKPGESAVYVVQFNGGVANVRVHTAILSVRTSSTRQSQLDVPVSASRISLGLTGPAATDLGTVAVGATTSQIVTFTNTTTTTLNISNVTSGIPVFSITPTTGTVAAGGTIDFTIVFAPQGEGAFAATIWIVTDAPCRDSVMLVTRGVGAAGSISAPNSVYFGTLTDCEQRLDSVTYVNTSVVPVDLIDVNIVGVANQLFTIVNPAAATNVTLPPSGSATVYINFNPRSYADGARTAQLVLRVRLNNQPVPFVTTLTGTRRTSLPSTPVEVAFGSIDIGASSMQLVSVVNSTATPVRITNVFLRNTSFGTISIVPAPVPKTLAPGERFDVQVTYAPVAQQNNVDSIVIAFDQPCQDERVIPVSGTGRLNVEISVILPKHTMDPASDSETLPVKAKVAVGSINLTGGTLHMTMRYTSSVFVVQSISRGTIIRNEVIGGQTFVEIEIANLDATTTESVIFELRGQATIGPIDSTDFVITDAFLDAGFVAPTVRREDGYLKLAVCEEGANPRLIMRGTPMSIRVSPNPVSDNLNIAVDLTEKGIHTVEVITLMGEVVNSMTFKADATGAAFEHDVDTRNIPAGAYQVVLQTPTRRRVTTLSIIH